MLITSSRRKREYGTDMIDTLTFGFDILVPEPILRMDGWRSSSREKAKGWFFEEYRLKVRVSDGQLPVVRFCRTIRVRSEDLENFIQHNMTKPLVQIGSSKNKFPTWKKDLSV